MKKKKPQKKITSLTSSHTKVIPLGDRVLVRPFTEDEVKGEKKSSFGIIIPDTISKEKSGQGKVLAVGEGKYVEGKLIPVNVKVGDIVFYSKYSYDEVTVGEEEFYLLKEDNILAVIK